MAVDSSAFYVVQATIDATIDTLCADIHTNLDDIISHLTEDGTTGYVSITSGEHSQFNKKLKMLEKQFRWYKDLAGMNKALELKGAYAEDYSNSGKECFVLDRIFIANP